MTPEHFLLIADALPEPMVLLSGDGHILAVNPATRELLGVGPEVLRGRTLAEIATDPTDRLAHYLRLCSRSRNPVLGAMTLRGRGGDVACRTFGNVVSPKTEGADTLLLLRLLPKQAAAGQFVALNRQIEQLKSEVQRRRRAEDQARQQEERLRVTLMSIGDAVITADTAGRVTNLNAVAESLTGWTTADATGQPLEAVFRIVNESTRQPVENPAVRALTEGVIVGLANHTVLIAKDGTERPIDDSAAPIRSADGELVGSVLVFRDITERRRVEALLAVQKTVLEMVATDAPLADVLSALAAAIEDRDLFCSVLLLDDDGEHVRVGAGPSLPADYLAFLDGQRIEPPYTGPCGMALHTGQPVVVTDAAADERWAAWRERMSGSGLRACRTTPILAAGGAVLGTFAVYSRRAGDPAPPDPNVLQIATRLAGITIHRRQKEAGLRASEARFRELADAMPQIVYVTDADGKIEFINRQWLDYTGQSDAGTADLAPVVHPADLPDMLRRWEQSAATGMPLQAEFRLRRASDGESRWFLTRSVPVRDAGGRVVRWYGTSTDIHDQKRAEEVIAGLAAASERQRRLYETVLTNTPDLAYVFDLSHRFTYANHALLTVLGRSWDDAIGKTCLELGYEPWHAAMHDREIEQVVATKQPIRGEVAFEGATGRREYDYIFVPVIGADGEVEAVAGTTRDVTEGKEAERAIRAGEERLRTALTAARMVAWEWTPADRKLRVSENAADVYGLPSGVELTSIDEGLALLHPDDVAAYRATFQQAISDRASYLSRYRLVRPDDGRTIWIEERGHAVADGTGGGVRLYGVAMDVTARWEAEEAVRRSEQFHRLLVEAVPGMVWSANMTDGLDYLSRRWEEYTGLTLEQIRQQGWAAVHHPDEVDAITARFADAAQSGQAFEMEFRYRRRDAAYRWHLGRQVPVAGDGGQMLRWVGTLIDVDDQKQVEAALRASEARHTFLVTLADSLRPLSDPFAVQAEASRVLGERLGASRVVYFEVRGGDFVVERDYTDGTPSIVGRYPVAAFGPDLLAAYLAGRTGAEADVDALPSRTPAEKEAFAAIQTRAYVGVPLVKDGAFVAGLAVHATRPRAWTPTEVAMIEDTAERTWAAVERVRAEQEVARLAADAERQRRLFDTALSNTTDYTFLFDLDGRVVYANRALLALWGRTADQALGKTLAELDYPADAEAQVSRNLRRVIETGEAVRDETPYTGPTGVTGHFEYILGPVLDAGRVIQVAGSSRDITGRKRMEDTLRDQAERLREADRRKDEFLATLAHELRNPLAPIRNGLQVIRMAGANGTIEQARSMMERQLGQMVRLVDDLLDVSRVTTGKLTLSTGRLELRAVIDAAVETTRPVVEQAGHELVVTVPDEPIFVEGDLTRLAQVVSNLLTNSAKYTHRGGHIRLTVERDGDSAVVSVKDDGIGIPPAMLDKVFVMFTQVDRTLEKTTGGLGIGLSLVKGLVEMHGGTIAARSEGEGRGSEFVVRLPVVTPAPALSDVSDKRVEDITPSGLRRILVVDDNADAADSLGQLLEMLGNEVRTAYDGEAGVAAAGAFRPAVVLCDIGMPKLNGYDAARRIREQPWGKSMVLVALTGWGQEDDRKRTADAGFDHHLVKPVEAAALMKLLAGLPIAMG